MAGFGELIVYYGDIGDFRELRPTNGSNDETLVRIVKAGIELAISIHETPRGKAHLVELAKEILAEAAARKTPFPAIYKDTPERMAYWVQHFLNALSEDFPAVYVSAHVSGEALVQRSEWGNKLSDYRPSLAGEMFISRVLIDNMANALGQNPPARREYSMFKFQLGISIAHEIVHLLTGFLLDKRADGKPAITPPALSVQQWGSTTRGEAGRYWESRFLGGILEMWSIPNHPLGNRQAGAPFIFADSRGQTGGYAVSEAYIAEILGGNFSFPIRLSSANAGPVTRAAMGQAGRLETTNFRTKRRQRGLPDPRLPPASSSSSIVYRAPTSTTRSW